MTRRNRERLPTSGRRSLFAVCMRVFPTCTEHGRTMCAPTALFRHVPTRAHDVRPYGVIPARTEHGRPMAAPTDASHVPW